MQNIEQENTLKELEKYIDILEEELESCYDVINRGENAINSFLEILEFIRTNFGDTADFPVRIDSDFYQEVFLKQIENCYQKVIAYNSEEPEEKPYEPF